FGRFFAFAIPKEASQAHQSCRRNDTIASQPPFAPPPGPQMALICSVVRILRLSRHRDSACAHYDTPGSFALSHRLGGATRPVGFHEPRTGGGRPAAWAAGRLVRVRPAESNGDGIRA